LPATPSRKYDYSASIYIKKSQVFGEGQILVVFFYEAACKGIVQSAWAVTQIESTDKWLRGNGSLAVPSGVQSMSVRLHVEKPFRSGALEVLFDAVRVTEAPGQPSMSPL